MEEEKYSLVKDALKANKVEFRAQYTTQGVKIFTENNDDFRKAINIIDEVKTKRSYFMLSEDKPLKSVIKGVVPGIPEEEIKKNLEDLDIPVETVCV